MAIDLVIEQMKNNRCSESEKDEDDDAIKNVDNGEHMFMDGRKKLLPL